MIFSQKVPVILSLRARQHEWVLRLNTLGTNVTARRALGSTSCWAGVFSVCTCPSVCLCSFWALLLPGCIAPLVVFPPAPSFYINISYFALICVLSTQRGQSIIFYTSNKHLTKLQDDQWGGYWTQDKGSLERSEE